MRKMLYTAVMAGLLMALMAAPALASGNSDESNGRPGLGPGLDLTVYVESQGLYYDSFVKADLPANGPFQKLTVVDGMLPTEFGPGDVGYLGGRWYVDVNNNGVMDEGEPAFICPLLGPGR